MAWLSIVEPTQTFTLNGVPYTISGATDQTFRMSAEQKVSFQQMMLQRGSADIPLRVLAGDTYAPTIGTEIFLYDQTASAWAPGFAFQLGQRIVDEAFHTQAVVSPGTTGGSEPSWDDSGGTTTDGTVTWQDQGLSTGIQFLCVFCGTIDKIELSWDGTAGDRLYHLTCVSLEACYDVVRVPPGGFAELPAGQIVATLWNQLMAGAPVTLPTPGTPGVPPTYGLSAGLIIPSISWTNWPRLSEVISSLATGSQYITGVNPQTQQLYFCPPDTTGAPFELTSDQIQWESMQWSQNRQDYRNRQILQIQAAAFAQSAELFSFAGGSAIPYFDLMRPPDQVTFAWLTFNIQSSATGTFSGNPSNGDTITISYPTAGSIYQFQNNYPYVNGQAVIDPNGNTQIVTEAGTSQVSGTPTWNTTVGDQTSSGSVVFTNQGVQQGGVYTFVTALDNTQWGQVFIGANANATMLNFIDAVNSNQATAGTAFSWPTWENPLLNATVQSGLTIKVVNKPAGAGYSAALATTSGAFSWSPSQTSGGTTRANTTPLAVAQNGQSSTANLYFTPGQLQVALASVPSGAGSYPPPAGTLLQVQYTRLGGDCIVCENTAQVVARAAIENGTGKYQQFSSDTSQASNAGGLVECQEELAAYLPIPTQFEFDTLVTGLLAGQVLTVTVSDLPPGIANLVNANWAVQEIRGELIPLGAGEGHYLAVPNAGHFRYTVTLIDVAQIGSWLDFWQDLIGGGSESSGLGATLGGGTGGGSTSGVNTLFTCRSILPGVQAVATNVLANRYRVTLASGTHVTLLKCTITAQIKAASSSFIADVLVSTDNGSTFNSLFPSGSSNKAVLPINTEQVVITPTWAISTLSDGNQIRVDVLQADGTAAGIEVLIEGTIGA